MRTLPISLLIPTMNRPDSLRRTLNTFFAGKSLPAQLIVVDQSQEQAVATENEKVVTSFSDRCNVCYIYQQIPSLTKARNNAFQYATENIIVNSDDDVDVYEDTLDNVYALMGDDAIAMVGAIDDNSETVKTNIGYLLGTKSYRHRKIGHVTLSVLGRFPETLSENVDTMWAMGFFFAIKKPLKDKWAINWDEKLLGYAYAEDLDFTYSYYKKAKKEGMSCIFSTNVHVKHLATREYRTPSKKATFMYVLNRAYISYKHKMGFKSTLAMNWCNFWHLIERMLKKQNAGDLKEAMQYYLKHREEVQQGKFPY